MKEKILIIEDDPLIRNELKTLLQSNGYEAAAPEDFSDVIDRIKAEQPHLILLDIKLPGTSGFSLCTEIRTFSEVPIIFVTSCNTDMDELNSIMLGGDAFITKPYNKWLSPCESSQALSFCAMAPNLAQAFFVCGYPSA